ncbi:MAG: tetratricopeptide repeat protein [Deferribacterota bacterium]|nr:tetratricopeptide repeat protein [Deferribacterota bacterium]
MSKKFIILKYSSLIIIFMLLNFHSLFALDEEAEYLIRLEERQKYCSEDYSINMETDLIYPAQYINPSVLDDISMLYCMAIFYENEGRLNNLMQNYREILSLDPNFIDILIAVGDLYQNSYFNDKDMAIVYYERALDVLDNNFLINDISYLEPYINVYEKIISVNKELGVDNDVIVNQYDELVNKLDNMLKNPQYENAAQLINDYELELMLDKAELVGRNEAIEIYEEILLDIDPKNKEAIEELANIYYDLGMLNEAKNLLEYAGNNIDGFKTGDFYLLLGEIYFNLGDYEYALELLNQAIYMGNSSADAYYYRGRAYYELGACEKAREDFERANSDWADVKCN